MRRSSLVMLALAAVLSAALAAQPPADFSGRWTLEATPVASTPAVPGTPAAAAAPGDMGSGWGSTMMIAQDATRLSVEYQVFSRYDLQPPLKFTYPLDGSEGRNTVMMGRGEQVESSRAQWNGQTLVITTRFQVTDAAAGKPFAAELTRKLWLESPTTLVVEVTRAGVLGGAASTTRSVYRKG
jgi:arylsulfatase